ncbi:MAG: cyclohexanecarboxylate-CoA ligase [Rhodospirillaceae bacterium]|nr:MAG: cyclohexanecarboxylate-CoA ligase [Rhodospirillaceae bacterium]
MTVDSGRVAGSHAPWSWLIPPAAHHRRYYEAHVWRNRTLADWARVRAADEPDAVVFPNDPTQPTYGELLTDAEALATSLAKDLGIKPGEVISFQTPNWIEAAVINIAATIGGFVVNPIIPIYRDAEVRQMLADSGARLLFFAENFRGYNYAAMVERIRGDLPALSHAIPVRGSAQGANFSALVAAGRGRPPVGPRVSPDDVKLLLYTSGTTGKPKGVLHSHNTLARVMDVSAAQWKIGAGDVILMPSPVTHISGYCNGLEQPFLIGTRTVLMENWHAATAVNLICQHKIVGTVAATPFLKELADEARSRHVTLPGFRIFACGGAAVPADLIREANASFDQPCAFRVYGSSETPLVTLGYEARDLPELAAATDGAVVDYEVRVLNDDGADVPLGQEGEIVARGPAMFMGYADEEQTRDALTEDGFFRSGDIGRLTAEGAIIVTGRKKDIIIRGGENISPKEIEDVLNRHPMIREAAVVAMPHIRLGEGICAYIVLRNEEAPTFTDIVAFVTASGIAKQKCPERVEYIDDLPRTASGKVRKDFLRARIAEKMARETAALANDQ